MTTTNALTVADNSGDSTSSDTISTTAEYKYAQLAVPSFQFDASASTLKHVVGSTTTTYSSTASSASGNSFVRLGSFPKITATTTVTDDGSLTSSTIGDDA